MYKMRGFDIDVGAATISQKSIGQKTFRQKFKVGTGPNVKKNFSRP